MVSISGLIESLVNALPDAVYLRATDYDANIEVDNIDLAGKTIYIYNNLPIINLSVGIAITPQWPVNIKLLQLVDQDANTRDKDLIRESMVKPAQELLSAILRDPISNQAVLPPSATIEFLNDEFDKTLTGVNLQFDIQLNQFLC